MLSGSGLTVYVGGGGVGGPKSHAKFPIPTIEKTPLIVKTRGK
jgi:hypothetical protein